MNVDGVALSFLLIATSFILKCQAQQCSIEGLFVIVVEFHTKAG